MIQPQRIKSLNAKETRKGRYVLYWMQQSQRAEYNHALEYAVREADESGLPVVVALGITQRFPEANLRHYAFMLEGLRESQRTLGRRGIQLVIRLQPPREAALDLAKDASLIVADRGYLRFQSQWRAHVSRNAPCKVVQVESDVVVPVELASEKQEYAARTIRKKIHNHLDSFLKPLRESTPKRDSLGMKFDRLKMDSVDSVLDRLRIDRTVGRVSSFGGGTSNAKRLLSEFIAGKLARYVDERNEPAADCVSHMSPYLHFGQISPLHVALQVTNASGVKRSNKDAYLEELVVRRELSMNYCLYNPCYDSYEGLPDWAKNTLKAHRRDKREYLYTVKELELARTHDPYWNAAQKEMVLFGKMHNYMRMYWGKKILEWAATPEEAFRNAIYLNNKYELDGRDPNSFTGVAWCFGRHDRPWTKRPVLGTVRYMSSAGLERKFDMEAYVRKVEDMERSQ
ncbi:MAG: deoxyribodipyrimidine photo-lyase [Candidatus Hydrogenedentota bacterium]|nr:MAG: deoxyribodipyrimidine photo-lyase [Candidatus Hydrogenedentota bacterium]